ncbi:hypothetical protein L596_023752 [Steinernema carpocapsae]|uniref:Uncharacterized protein n=1 Tax=Steinernema carpocapsae TaxID=34508 RepID=A0A4U5MEK9_STECR|nr:hypothetical protein L596_023752 [Steinernema carpocapsae]
MNQIKLVFVVGLIGLVAVPLFSDALKCHVVEQSPKQNVTENNGNDTCDASVKYCVSILGKDENKKPVIQKGCENTHFLRNYYGVSNSSICEGHKASFKIYHGLLTVTCCQSNFCNGASMASVSVGLAFVALLKYLL